MGKRRKDPPRIGEYLPCDSDLLERALLRQRELAGSGVRKRLGEILLETGAVTQEDLVTAIQCGRARSRIRAGGNPAPVRLANRRVASPWREKSNLRF